MRPVTLRIAVGPANSDDLKVVQALAQAFNNQHTARSGCARCRPTAPPRAPTLLGEGKADLAIIRGDLDVPKNAQAVATLRKNVAVLWVPPAGKGQGQEGRAEDHQDRAARRTPHRRGRPHPGQCQSAQGDPAAIRRRSRPRSRSSSSRPTRPPRRSSNQKADAYLAAGPVNSKITTDAIAASTRDGGTPTFLAIDSAEAIAQNHPAYEASEIPAGTFGGSPDRPEDEVKTISFSHHIVARKGVSESTIAAFTRQLFAIRQSLKTEFPLAAKIETPDTDKDATIPVHPGAAAFVDGEEKTFLDRYSDYIWWGLMALSAMGSAGAWFAGYLKKDERNNNSSLARAAAGHDRGRAHAAIRPKSSTRCRPRPTTSCATRCSCFEHGAIEEGALTAFNIALEQFHNAVADRKALLMSMPQNLQRAGAQFRAAGNAVDACRVIARHTVRHV